MKREPTLSERIIRDGLTVVFRRFNLARNQKAVLAAMEFLDVWTIAIEEAPDSPQKDCHQNAIRLAKGMIKYWRLWLALDRSARNLGSSSDTQTASLDEELLSQEEAVQ